MLPAHGTVQDLPLSPAAALKPGRMHRYSQAHSEARLALVTKSASCRPYSECHFTLVLQSTRCGAPLQAGGAAAAEAEGGAGALRCLLLLQQLPMLQVIAACCTSTRHNC